MPNGNQLPFGWREYKAYLKTMVKEINYPGVWDKPERKADLERMISEAESILGANPEMAFTAGNFNLLMSLPYFAAAFEYSTGTSPTSWYNLYVKTAPEVTPTGVESRGGYDFLVDEAGNIISSLGRTPDVAPDELTRWQQAQLQQAQQEMAWQREQAMWGREEAMLPYGQMTAYQQAQMQLSQMQYAAQLAALGEEGWIEQHYAQQAQRQPPPVQWDKEGYRNPYVAYLQKYDPDRLRELVEQGFAPREMLTEPLAQFGEPYRKPEEYTYQAGPVWEPPAEGQRVIKVSPEGGVEVTAKPAPMGRFGQVTRPEAQPTPPFREGEFVTKTPRRGGRPSPQPTGPPPTPEWLPQFAPWLTAGQPIERGQMPTPSGQMWGQRLPSELAGLRGFTKWGGAGRTYEDIYAHMLQMQPQAPWGGRGRWPAARQV